jgi:alpha-tubulin suppressor-like RCC1 family protein
VPKNPLPGRAVLGAILAVSAAAVGCSSAAPPVHVTARVSWTTTVLRWGSFFGGVPRNVGTRLSPVPVTLPGKVVQVGTSNAAQYALLSDGRLYAWGIGTQGELGNGRRKNSVTRAVRVRFPAGVKIVSIPADAMPYDTGLAVDTRGRAWGWGDNGGGELCLGNLKLHTTPVRLPLRGVTTLAGASNHALYDAGGTVYACGKNMKGDLGTGNTRGTLTPAPVARLDGRRVIRLVASFANSGALLSDGSYYDWGDDSNGKLGNRRPLKFSGVPVRVPLHGRVTDIAQGGSWWNNGQSVAQLANGTLWSWGNNQAGQLGNHKRGARAAPVRFRLPRGVTAAHLATGAKTSYAVSRSGKVYAWGTSHVGQAGTGSTRTRLKPVLVASGAIAISSTANNVVINIPGRRCRPRRCPAIG